MILDEAQPIDYYGSDLTAHKEDHGTSHVSTLDHEGNAVSRPVYFALIL
jgi:gamma-glutamyltranspeptidase